MISPIVGFSKYKIDSESAEITNGDGRVVKARIDARSGYLKIDLTDDTGRRRTRLVHVLQALTHIGAKPTEFDEVLHKDGKQLNCSAGNLRYGTKLENGRDRVAHGTNLPGERNAQAKFSNKQARVIAWCGTFGTIPACWLANLFETKVSDETVLRLWRRQSWLRVIKDIHPATRLRPLTTKQGSD